jgi:hypothetical protein
MSVTHLNAELRRSSRPDEPKQVPNIADMRRVIVCGAHDSGLIQECLEVAACYDLDEEEMYVCLAFRALTRPNELDSASMSLKPTGATEPIASFDVDGHF